MKLLLDTHIWIWSVLEPKRLSARITRELANSENELWLSSISVWELLLLHRKRRIKLDQEVRTWVRDTLVSLPLNEAPLTVDIALEISTLNLPHGDPADHFLVATAKVFGLTLVTADAILIKEASVPVLANK